jgi:hypothetical protein
MTIIGTSFLSVLSGIDSFSGMQLFAEAHLEELEKYFDFPSGPPSHDTFQRFWDSISTNKSDIRDFHLGEVDAVITISIKYIYI